MSQDEIDQHISEITINGLSGRLLYLPAPKKTSREILLVYGHHSSIERMWAFAQCFNRYGSVTVPDLPGFGGMDSFYKIKKKPNIDNLADYLAAVIKLRFKKRPITIIGYSLAFAVVTRMLQKYPSITDRVELCVSGTGFVHHDDFLMKPSKQKLIKYTARLMSFKLPSMLSTAFLRRPIIESIYSSNQQKAHSPNETDERRKYRLDFEVWLWQNNDLRTHFYTVYQMMKLNLCDIRLDIPVYHISISNDQFLNNHNVEQHLRVIYQDFTPMNLPNKRAHAPTILTSKREALVYIPLKLRRLLSPAKTVARKPKTRHT